MLQRASLALVAVTTATLALLGGCSGPASEHAVVLWHPWGGMELAALKEAIGRYQTAHPEVEIQALQVPSDKLQDKYLRSSAANGGPDLLIGPVDWIGKYAQSEVISPLEGTVATASLDRYQPVAIQAMTYRSHLYALPESLETLALYYNKKVLTGAPPATLQDLFIKANSRDYYRSDFLLAYNTQFFFSAGYMFGMGGRLFAPDGQVELVGAGAEHWLKFLHDLKVHPRIAAKSDYARADALFRDGKAAMTVNGPWALGDYRKALGADLGTTTLPMVEDGVPAVPFVGVKCFMFNPNSGAAARERAVAFATYMTSPEIARLTMDRAGHIPAVRDVQVPAGDLLGAFAEQARWGTPLPAAPEMKEMWAPMDQAIEKVMTDVAPPTTAIQTAREVIAAKIEAVRKQ